MTHDGVTHGKRSPINFFMIGALLFTIALAALPITKANAADQIYTSLFSNNAVGGYDATSYFDGTPVKGNKKYSMTYKGAKWLFASAENLEKFRAQPEKFAPQYGGYCAYAAAIGQTAKGDPTLWDVHEGKLYLNINKEIKDKWVGSKEAYIEAGDKNWPTLLD